MAATMDGNVQHQHLRDLLGVHEEYVSYCREERNYAAVLYHLLLDAKRLRSFLKLIGQDADAVKVEEVRIYFEYAHLRDLWAEVACQERKKDQSAERALRETNDRYRETIVSILRMPEKLQLQLSSITAFNKFFTGPRVKAASSKQVQMPSRWSNSQFEDWSKWNEEPFGEPPIAGTTPVANTFAEQNFAERVCSLNWAFNAKPDLVLHLGADRAICIEAKLESGAGSYKAKSGINNMGQLKLQEFVLRDLLGYDVDDNDFIIISKNKNRKEGDSASKWRGYSWHEVFETLLEGQPSTTGESPMVALFRGSKLINPH